MKRIITLVLAFVMLFTASLEAPAAAFASVRPPETKIVSVKGRVKGFTVKWEKQEVDGYQIMYSRKKSFKKRKKITVNGADNKKYTVKNLKEKKRYYVKVRTFYLLENGKRKPSKWSKVKKVKTKAVPKMVALTFDDGPGYNNASDQILDVLEKYNAKATFFMVGKNALDHPKNLERKIALGCELGNHTQTHEHYGSNVTRSDIKKCTASIKKACGQKPTCFRSPGGSTTSLIRDECKKEGMPLYYWSIDTLDWKYRNEDHVYNAVMDNVKDGDIILMHELYYSTADAVERIVPALIKRGYKLVTCEELIKAKTGKEPQPGVQYYSATKSN
ncbi:MAG: polysaccharide deacetylase family protein [Eubacterium sp.]|nr:polysaccharide deacetylase family protein [Eubacterium sp.]